MKNELNMTWGAQLWRLLRSPRLTLSLLLFIAVYAGVLVWLPWVSDSKAVTPEWAVSIGIDHPFSSLPFLIACLTLFLNTFACTWERTRKISRLWRGDLPASSVLSTSAPGVDSRSFLISQGFRQKGQLFFRYRFALWGGWVLHVGILLLLASVTVQQSCFDGGSFELSDGETIHLAEEGAVFSRERGRFAPAKPPALEVSLVSFDPFLHQKGYAPDRASRLKITTPEGKTLESLVDRARGVEVGGVTFYQAIPSGLALNISVPGMGVRSFHLRSRGARTAAIDVKDPDGRPVRFSVEAERGLNDRRGTGELAIQLQMDGKVLSLAPGVPFEFGPTSATIVSISRWGGFTYARSPGISLVFAGFFMVLSGCLLLVFPTGVARLLDENDGKGFTLYLSRGIEAIIMEWDDFCTAAADTSPGAN